MIYELLGLSQVLDKVQQTGTEVRYHAPECYAEKIAGMYQLNANVDRLTVCADNQLNHSDLFDTIRHESIHVVQACNGGKPIMSYDYWLQNATYNAKQNVSEYPKDEHVQHMELEAFTLAEVLNEQQVINLLDKYCFE